MGLWSVARLLSNSHIAELDLNSPTTFDSLGVVYTAYAPLNTGAASTNGGSYGGQINNDQQSFFDYNLREYLNGEGLINEGGGGSEYLNIDQYDPNIFKLDMFSPDELLNSGGTLFSLPTLC